MIKSGRMGWAGRGVRIERRISHRVWWGDSREREKLGWPRSK